MEAAEDWTMPVEAEGVVVSRREVVAEGELTRVHAVAAATLRRTADPPRPRR